MITIPLDRSVKPLLTFDISHRVLDSSKANMSSELIEIQAQNNVGKILLMCARRNAIVLA